ncbi:MAG TPA: DsbA family oxidoreductase [Lysobacter sp.]
MKIEFWCDIVCPFCGLAEYRLENALAAFEHRAEVQVIHRSFQLHPELDRNGVSQRDLLVMRVKDPDEIESKVLRPLEVAAAREGLTPYRVVDRTLGPTDHVHELLAYASDQGLHSEAWKRAFRTHFGEARKLWTIDEVATFAVELGLDEVEARAALLSRRYREQVENDQREARLLGATGTPFLVIDRRFVIRGAQTTEELLSILLGAWQDRKSG